MSALTLVRIRDLPVQNAPLTGSELFPFDGGDGQTHAVTRDSLLPGDLLRNGAIGVTVAGLGADGKLSPSVIPQSLQGVLQFKGLWNVQTNDRNLQSGVGTQGVFYVVGTPGTYALDGVSDWRLGDWAVFDGTKWDHLAGLDGVMTVNGKGGAAVVIGPYDVVYTVTNADGSKTATTVGDVLDSLRAQVAAIASDVAGLKASRTTDEGRLDTLETEYGALNGQVGTIQTDVNSLKQSRQTDEGNFTNFQQSVSKQFGDVQTALGTKLNSSTLGQSSGTAQLDTNAQVPASQLGNVAAKIGVGQPSGVAQLDSQGHVPTAQLPPSVPTTADVVTITDTRGVAGPAGASAKLQSVEDALAALAQAAKAEADQNTTDVASLKQSRTQDEGDISTLKGQYAQISQNAVLRSMLGVANGVATLDGMAAVPVSQLAYALLVSQLGIPSTATVKGLPYLDQNGKLDPAFIPVSIQGALQYQGTWNAATNQPALQSSVGVKGQYYVVNTPGTTSLDGHASWQKYDWVVFDGTVWDSLSGNDGITSVNGYKGPSVVLAALDIAYANGAQGATVSSQLDLIMSDIANHEQRIASLEASRTTDEQRLSAVEASTNGNSTSFSNLQNQVNTIQTNQGNDEQDISSLKASRTQDEATLASLNSNALLKSAVGAKGGVAGLDNTQQVPSAQLGYAVLQTQLGQPTTTSGGVTTYGVATLDANGKVNAGQVSGNPSTVASNVTTSDSNGYGATVQAELTGIASALSQTQSKQTTDEGNISSNTSAIGTHTQQIGALQTSVGNLQNTVAYASQIGQPTTTSNGVTVQGIAPLGTDGRLAPNFLPATIQYARVYKGTWDPTTNTPALASGQGTAGYTFVVSVASTASKTTILDGCSQWDVGDEACFNGTTWDVIRGAKTVVNTVNGVAVDSVGNIQLFIPTSAYQITAADPNSTGFTQVQGQLNYYGQQITANAGNITTLQGQVATLQSTSVTQSQIGAATTTTNNVTRYGIPPLDANKLIPPAYIPPNATTSSSNSTAVDTYNLLNGGAGASTYVQTLLDAIGRLKSCDAGFNGTGIDAGYNGY